MVSFEEGDSIRTSSEKRRARRKKLRLAARATDVFFTNYFNSLKTRDRDNTSRTHLDPAHSEQVSSTFSETQGCDSSKQYSTEVCQTQRSEMSSKESTDKSRDEVKAAREAKKLAKQKAKNKGDADNVGKDQKAPGADIDKSQTPEKDSNVTPQTKPKCVDEVDRASVKQETIKPDTETSKEQVLAERAAKKAAKQAKKKGEDKKEIEDVKKRESIPDTANREPGDIKPNPDMTVRDVVETLKDIKKVAKDVQDLTAKVSAISFEAKDADSCKSKADLKAQRRAKQEAQRAAKQATMAQKAAPAAEKPAQPQRETTPKMEVSKEKSPKPKTDKVKVKSQTANRVNWFQHLHTEVDNETLNKIPINSNLHPAVIKLGVQLATRVVTGSNARCVALLDALKKMVKDYALPAKTEFSRGLESHLAASLQFLWAMRQPSASQTNAIKYFRHHLTQLPNNVDEFDAKKKLQEEIDKYIEDQIDKAGEAISEAVRNKISTGDNILTYGCSSLIERILREAWEAKVEFRTVVVGNRVHNGAREMLRRLTTAGLHCTYADITAISYVMKSMNKVIVGASALLVTGSVLGAVGTAQVALAARECNVPVLVACETHKFSENVQTDAFVYNEIGNPDDLLDKSDPNSPLKDWRTNPNLTLLNLTYDVTPPSLVTAVVTEKAILPCTSAPVVLRTKLSEYGM